MSEGTKDLALTLEGGIQNKFISLIESNQYPVSVKTGIKKVSDIIGSELCLTDLYPTILAEVSVSTSQFQDKCVQLEQHFTPHRKLRQIMLELQGKLDALYTAKTGYKKSVLKLEKFKVEQEIFNDEIEHESSLAKQHLLKIKILEKEVKIEETSRGINLASHMIKDATLKVVQLQNLVEQYEKEVQESGLSYEEAEVVYYVLYFTADAERQIRTSGRVDTGTWGAISQTPEAIRKKILSNIDFIENKLRDWPKNGDYLHIVYRDLMVPEKTGDNEFEGMKIDEFIGVETIKILALEE